MSKDFEKALNRAVEGAKCRNHVVSKEHHNWISTEQIAEKLRIEFSSLSFPWLEAEHIHGVNSIVTGVCEKHKLLVPMHLGNLWRGTTKYGCPECAWEKGYSFEGHEEFNIKRNRPNYVGQSGVEFALFCRIKDEFPDALAHHKMPGRKEIDIWIPSIGCGVEYNGTYYHSSAMGKTEDYHYAKSKLANKLHKGIFHLFPEEAQDSDRIVRLLKFLQLAKQDGQNEVKLSPGAKLDVKCLMSRQAKDFHATWNFIELKDSMLDLHYGLFSDDELIGVVSGNSIDRAFCKLSFKKAFFDFRSLLDLLNKQLGGGYCYVIDIRNPIEVGLIDSQVGTKLKLCPRIAPVAYPLNSKFEFIPRNMARISEMLNHHQSLDDLEIARTWDCGHLVYVSPTSKSNWAKPLK